MEKEETFKNNIKFLDKIVENGQQKNIGLPVEYALQLAQETNAGCYLVYSVLLSHIAENGYCRATQKQIAEETGMDRKTVYRCIKKLMEAGFLQVITARGEKHYLFTLEKFLE